MTNEEKIKEITSEYSSEILCSGAYYGAKEMAEWKDAQFKEYLEKKREFLCYKPETARVCNYALLTEIINELFKED